MKNWTKYALVAPLISTNFLTALHIAPAQAEEDAYLLNEIIVTTTRSATSRFDNPGNVTTLESDEKANLYPVEFDIRHLDDRPADRLASLARRTNRLVQKPSAQRY